MLIKKSGLQACLKSSGLVIDDNKVIAQIWTIEPDEVLEVERGILVCKRAEKGTDGRYIFDAGETYTFDGILFVDMGEFLPLMEG